MITPVQLDPSPVNAGEGTNLLSETKAGEDDVQATAPGNINRFSASAASDETSRNKY